MRCLKLLFASAILCYATLSVYPQKVHECLITLKRYSKAEQLKNQDVEPELVGKLDIDSPDEGTSRKLAYDVKDTKMRVFVDILYDDNLEYYAEWLHYGINMTMTISEDVTPTMSKSIAVTTSQVELSKSFLQTSFGTLVKNGQYWYDFWLTCRLKDDAKQKELEKIIDNEKKEQEREKLTQKSPSRESKKKQTIK